MATGTLPFALSQQVDIAGRPLAGALLYFYIAGSVQSPVNSYQDAALTITNPWPLVADATGRIPNFYLGVASVHARLTDASGTVIFDVDNMLVMT